MALFLAFHRFACCLRAALAARAASSASTRLAWEVSVSMSSGGANMGVPLCSSESMQKESRIVSMAISTTPKNMPAAR
jgi:hypothetical protein